MVCNYVGGENVGDFQPPEKFFKKKVA